jgi:hypothetical protein
LQGQRSFNHGALTFRSGGPWDRGNPCRRRRSGRGRQGASHPIAHPCSSDPPGSFAPPTPRIRPDSCAVIGFVSQFFANRNAPAPTTARAAASRCSQPHPDARSPPGTRLSCTEGSSSLARQAQRSTIGCGSLVQYRNEFNRSRGDGATPSRSRVLIAADERPGRHESEEGTGFPEKVPDTFFRRVL